MTTPKVNLRAVPCSCTLQAAVESAFSQLDDLRSECQEIVDNASEGLSQTQRIQTLGETASSLSSADCPPDVPDCVAELIVHYTEDRRKSKSQSRATRCAEACELLSAATGALQKWLEENAEHESADEVESLCSELDDMLGNAESCEFPGMFC